LRRFRKTGFQPVDVRVGDALSERLEARPSARQLFAEVGELRFGVGSEPDELQEVRLPRPERRGRCREARFLVWVLVDEVPERGEHVAGAVGLVELSDVVFRPALGR